MIYNELMLECWEMDPEKRPSFKELCDRIKNISKTISKSGEGNQTPGKSPAAVTV